MTNLFYLPIGILGAIFGSFANVLILRDNKRASIVTGRSECPSCKHILGVTDLIPILSYIGLGGKCRYCRKLISWQYPLVEAIAACLALYAFWYGLVQHGSVILTLGLFVSLMSFLILSVIDIRTLSVTWDYCLLAGVAGGLGQVLAHTLSLQAVLLGAAVGAGSIIAIIYGWKLIFKQDGMGSGDIWIAAAVGACVGWPSLIVALYGAILIGALYGVSQIIARKKSMGMEIPFGPFLAIGVLIALQWGQQLVAWYILNL